jgi:hypothetical protein
VSARPWRVLLVYSVSPENATFSYQQAWPRHFAAHSRFAVTPLNLSRSGVGYRIAAALAVRRWRGDAIVLLHSVFSNSQNLGGRLFEAVARRPEPKAFFIGNEYKAMPEKMQFCDALGLSLLVSQSSSPAVHALYRERLGCAVAGIPNTGLDQRMFSPLRPVDERPFDLGYRADLSPIYLGHTERSDIAAYFTEHAKDLQLTVDISLDRSARFDEAGWACFLNRCKGQLGTEAGGDYFELTDRTRVAVNAFEREHPNTPPAEILRRFFHDYQNPVPLRVMSGRHVEAAGTRTVQILFEGHYDGYLQPDEHYIPLKKDFSNVHDVMRKFRDRAHVERMVENAHLMARQQLTYEALLDRFSDVLGGIASPARIH